MIFVETGDELLRCVFVEGHFLCLLVFVVRHEAPYSGHRAEHGVHELVKDPVGQIFEQFVGNADESLENARKIEHIENNAEQIGLPLLIGRELGGVAHEGVRVDSNFLCEEVARNLCAENRAALEDARVDAVGAVFVEIRHGHNAAHGRGAQKHCVVPGELLHAGDVFVQLVRDRERVLTEIVGEIVALVNAVVGVVGQLGVRGHAVCGVAVFVHLQIAEDAADSIDERVAESVIVLVYGEARYCRRETRGEAQISGGVGSEEQTLVFCALVKIQLRAAESRDINNGRRAAGAF